MTKPSNIARPTLRPGQPGLGLGLLFSSFLFFLCIVGFLQSFLGGHMTNATAMVRISAILQDIFVFMLPALLTSMLITRLPASFLLIDRKPSISFMCVTIICLIVAIPFMNYIVHWNAGIELPESMGDFAQWAQNLESGVAETVALMMGDKGIGSIIIGVCIIGVLAPVCEELFFRGALQRLLLGMRMNAHVAIWITAIIFSAVHLQFFGFVPRLLLGALFGYVAYWSGSLWTSIAAHIFNNTVAVLAMYLSVGNSTLDTMGTDGSTTSWILVGVSCMLSIMGVAWLSCHRPVARKRP